MNERYNIQSLLSKDHAGGIYEGEDTVLNRKVACRRFYVEDDNVDTSNWEDDFKSYCHKLTALHHPNLAMVYDAGIDEDGAFLISQLMDGHGAHHLLAEGPLSEYEVYALAKDILDAFIMIHSQNETHGALVPKSIVRVSKVGGRYLHSIIDLGIASLIPIMIGKPYDNKNPALTAPEQLENGKATVQTDLFMLGQLCYVMAAQGHPFSEATKEEAIELHRGKTQTPLNELAPHIGEDFSNWVALLTDPDPKKRPKTSEDAMNLLPVISAPMPQTTPQSIANTPQNNANKLLTGVASNQTTVANPQAASSVTNAHGGLHAHTQTQAGLHAHTQTQAGLHAHTQTQAGLHAHTQTQAGLHAHTQTQAGLRTQTQTVQTNPSPAMAPQLASARSGNKKIIIVSAVAAVVVTIIGAVFFIQKDKKEDQAKKKQQHTFDTKVSINQGKMIIEQTEETMKTPKAFDLSNGKYDDYIVQTSEQGIGEQFFKKDFYILNISKTNTSSFNYYKDKGIPTTFKVGPESVEMRPNIVSSTDIGLSSGEGWDVEFKMSEKKGNMHVDLYIFASHSNFAIKVLEKNAKTDKLTELNKTSISCPKKGVYQVPVKITDYNPKNYYYLRIFLEEKTESIGYLGILAIGAYYKG